MRLPNIKILDESNKILRQVSKEVTFPLDEKLKKLIDGFVFCTNRYIKKNICYF